MSNRLQFSNKLLNSCSTLVLYFLETCYFRYVLPFMTHLFSFPACRTLSSLSPSIHHYLPPLTSPSPAPPPHKPPANRPTNSQAVTHQRRRLCQADQHPETAHCLVLTQQKQQTIITSIPPHQSVWLEIVPA